MGAGSQSWAISTMGVNFCNINRVIKNLSLRVVLIIPQNWHCILAMAN